jgi:Uncharacterized conserved protein (DUF2267)
LSFTLQAYAVWRMQARPRRSRLMRSVQRTTDNQAKRTMTNEQFINEVARQAGVSKQQAEPLTKAVLSALADRLTGGEADDVASQLPKGIKEAMVRAPRRRSHSVSENSSTGSPAGPA